MSPRTYRPGRRAEAAEETRRRIVEATFALHEEQGIAATSMKQIAARAGVSVGTVYHHFPTYEDAVVACGQHTGETVPAPTGEILRGIEGVEGRVRRLVAEFFAYYGRLPVIARLRCDQHLVPAVREFVAAQDANRRALIAEAAGVNAVGRAADLGVALTDPAVHASLIRDGWSADEAAEAVARTLIDALPERGR